MCGSSVNSQIIRAWTKKVIFVPFTKIEVQTWLRVKDDFVMGSFGLGSQRQEQAEKSS